MADAMLTVGVDLASQRKDTDVCVFACEEQRAQR
jgi:hypothetical protein